MPAQLRGVHPRFTWFSYLGALGGCLDYLGLPISPEWLYGGTGLAFMMNMGADVDPGSPVAWEWLCVNPCHERSPGMVSRLGPNLGYRTRDVCSCLYGQARDVDAARERAWKLVRESIDQGLPCLGFELAHPEFFVIAGYTDDAYTFLVPAQDGSEAVADSRPWREIGSHVQYIRVQAVVPGSPGPDEVVVRESLRAVTAAMSGQPNGGPFVTGLAGWNLWAAALQQGLADSFGHRYNVACYAELRTQAVAFLRETKARLPGRADGLLDQAIVHYLEAAGKLEAAHALHPFMDVEGERLRSDEAAALIRDAAAADRQGFALLEPIADAMA
jgi:hypothetical protein